MRRSRGTLFMVIGVLMLLIAGGLFYRNMREEEQADLFAKQTLKQIQMVIPTLEEKSEAMLAAASNPDSTALVAAQAQEAQDAVAESTQMQTIQIKEETYIGVIAIPSLNLELTLNSGWNSPKPAQSP